MRVGVFGGSFDPPHLGHLIVAADAYSALRLDHVLWVPAAMQPHKRARVRTPAEIRLEMVRAAIAGDDRFVVDDRELRRAGPSYTADTLGELTAAAPGVEWFLLIGADAYAELPTWHRPGEIVSLARVAVLARAGEIGGAAGAEFAALRVPVTRIDVSATEVRRRVACGESIRYLVPEAVRAIIERERLYRDVPIGSEERSC